MHVWFEKNGMILSWNHPMKFGGMNPFPIPFPKANKNMRSEKTIDLPFSQTKQPKKIRIKIRP